MNFFYIKYLNAWTLGCLDSWGSRSETPGRFWNVVLEKDGKDHLDRSCEK